jgi:hypothetical protein
MKQMTLEYDEETEALLKELQKFFGVKTKSAVIRRALAVSKAAKKYADEDNNVRFANPTDSEKQETFIMSS